MNAWSYARPSNTPMTTEYAGPVTRSVRLAVAALYVLATVLV